MREAVLNSAGLAVPFDTSADALLALDDVAAGLILLTSGGYIARNLWMHAQPYEIEVCAGTNLFELFVSFLEHNRDKARFLLSLATRCPLDDGVEEANLEDFLENEIEGMPGCDDLLLCAVSGTKIAASLSPLDEWHRNPLRLNIGRDGAYVETRYVENVYSHDSAQETIDRLNGLELADITPGELWERRDEFFPNLLFGEAVERQLLGIGADLFKSAIVRLVELDKAAATWDTTRNPCPPYLSKVTGESTATMQKYGGERVFRSSFGTNEVFEKHARLQSGGRIHLREIVEQQRIEIGYVGKHLRIVSEN